VAKLAALWRREGVFSEATCALFRARAAPGAAPPAPPTAPAAPRFAALAAAAPATAPPVVPWLGPGAGPAGGRAGEGGLGSLAPQGSAAPVAGGRAAAPPAAAAAASHAGARCILSAVNLCRCSFQLPCSDVLHGRLRVSAQGLWLSSGHCL